MRINSLLLTTILIGIGHAAMSAEEITKCLSDTATQFTDLDAKAQRINLSTFVGLQSDIASSYSGPINRERDCGNQLSQVQESPGYDTEQQQQICAAYKSSAQPHQSFFNSLIINKNTIKGYGAAPMYSDLITEERKQHEAFSTGISNAVPDCVQDVSDAKGALDSKFDQIISALAA